MVNYYMMFDETTKDCIGISSYSGDPGAGITQSGIVFKKVADFPDKKAGNYMLDDQGVIVERNEFGEFVGRAISGLPTDTIIVASGPDGFNEETTVTGSYTLPDVAGTYSVFLEAINFKRADRVAEVT